MEQVIAEEDKSKPLPDEDLAVILKERGYPIARRTVAKYREQLDIPVARLKRKSDAHQVFISSLFLYISSYFFFLIWNFIVLHFEGNLVSDIHMYFTFFQILPDILTVILPLCFYLLLRILNLVSSFTGATLEERKIPIFIQMALMYVLLRYGGLQESEPVLSHFFEGGFISSFIVLISVSVGFKASLHDWSNIFICFYTFIN